MATTVEQLAKQAMSLPSESRARLADLLVESLDSEDLGDIAGTVWPRAEFRHRAEVGLLHRSQAVESNAEEALVQRSNGDP